MASSNNSPNKLNLKGKTEKKKLVVQVSALTTCTVHLRNNHPKICMYIYIYIYIYMRLRLSVHAFPAHLIKVYEPAYCLLIVLICC